MSQIAEDIIRERRTKVAREYKKKGYQVRVEPSTAELPTFLTPHMPDLIARNDEETVVIEVKSREALAKSTDLTTLAKAVASQAGWRFELIVVSQPDEIGTFAASPVSLSRTDIIEKLEQAVHLNRDADVEAALLLSWAGAEAAMRLLGNEEGIDLSSLSPLAALKTIFTLGLLDREDYKVLERAFKARSLIIHGYDTRSDSEALTSDLVMQSIASITRLLTEQQPESTEDSVSSSPTADDLPDSMSRQGAGAHANDTLGVFERKDPLADRSIELMPARHRVRGIVAIVIALASLVLLAVVAFLEIRSEPPSSQAADFLGGLLTSIMAIISVATGYYFGRRRYRDVDFERMEYIRQIVRSMPEGTVLNVTMSGSQDHVSTRRGKRDLHRSPKPNSSENK